MVGLVGCAGGEAGGSEVDPATVLIELADTHYDVVMNDVIEAIGDPVCALAHGPDNQWLSGTLALPADAGDAADLDGELTVDWQVRYESEALGDSGESIDHWFFLMNLRIARLALPSAEVAGDAHWEVHQERWDYTLFEHQWLGVVSIDGGEPVSAAWILPTTTGFDGTIDGQNVDWENPGDQP